MIFAKGQKSDKNSDNRSGWDLWDLHHKLKIKTQLETKCNWRAPARDLVPIKPPDSGLVKQQLSSRAVQPLKANNSQSIDTL